MFSLLAVLIVQLRNVFVDRRDLLLENAALRKQLAIYQRKGNRPKRAIRLLIARPRDLLGRGSRRGIAMDRRLLVALAATALPVAFLLIAAWNRRWMSDDGFIHLRVVDQLLHGNGPVFNAGERVEVSTSPLWVALLALTKLLLFPARLEWITVVWGMVLSVAGLAFAERGAWLLAERDGGDGRRPWILPMGALVVAALPPFWDFATSGLEGGMVFGWLGISFWALASTRVRQSAGAGRGWFVWATAVVVGLGPLIRPDLGVLTLAFMFALLVVDQDHRIRHRLAAGSTALALPLVYQVFRMAYYAALIPNTAIAKEAGTAQWGRGFDYLRDYGSPYWLWLPAVVVAGAALAPLLLRAGRARDGKLLALVLAPAVGGLLHAAYFIAIGGDFMHARLLLPATFALLLPVSVVPVRSRAVLGAVIVVTAWAVVCAATLRTPYDVWAGLLANERNFYVVQSQHSHPVTIDQFAAGWAQYGVRAREAAGRGERIVEVTPDWSNYPTYLKLPLAAGVHATGVIFFPSIGEVSYAAGPGVYVVDLLGLGDPIGSRVRLRGFVRAGHSKLASPAWGLARFADPRANIPDPVLAAAVADARAAVQCSGLAVVLDDVSGRPTMTRLLASLFDSWSNTRLRFDRDPAVARSELCRTSAPP
jgi:arabinofuranosyltransferase